MKFLRAQIPHALRAYRPRLQSFAAYISNAQTERHGCFVGLLLYLLSRSPRAIEVFVEIYSAIKHLRLRQYLLKCRWISIPRLIETLNSTINLNFMVCAIFCGSSRRLNLATPLKPKRRNTCLIRYRIRHDTNIPQ